MPNITGLPFPLFLYHRFSYFIHGLREALIYRGHLARGLYLIKLQGDLDVFRKLMLD